ncbi:MAG: hypothetical protein KF891_07820 [Rhizobacter sp.]|nr:hypothetical protein [Rhizobacter sp.]
MTLRVYVLVLLALLLPLRGLSAATLLCEQHPMSHAETVAHAPAPQADARGGTTHDHHDHAGAEEGPGHHCLSSCSAPLLMSEPPALAVPAIVGMAVYPRLAAPAPSFLSGGQDRPPRRV